MPTDERFKTLRYETKLLLFTGFMELPTSEQLKYAHDHVNTAPHIDTKDEENFKKLGYSDAKIRWMKEQLRKAGLQE